MRGQIIEDENVRNELYDGPSGQVRTGSEVEESMEDECSGDARKSQAEVEARKQHD